jgi:CheY-like chemotaxis protein
VDDESVVAEVGKMQLEKLGYLVDARTSSFESIDLFANDPGKYDLVMTDMTMPGITGKELAEKMIEIRADIPIVLCSGLNHQIDKDDAKQMGIKAFVMKPFKLQEIAHTIREVLDEALSGQPPSQFAN